MNLAETKRKLVINKTTVFKSAVWLSLLLAIILTAALIGFLAFSGGFAVSQVLGIFLPVSFITVGSLIIIRRPENRIGRLCLIIGWLDIPIQSAMVVETANLANDLLPLLTRLELSLGQIFVMLMLVYLPLLFPTSHYLTPRWRRFGRCFALLMTLPIFLTSIKPGLMFDWTADPDNIYRFVNPFGVNWPWLAGISDDHLFAAWSFPTMVAIFLSVGSLILRWRRSQGDTRQQIKWVVFYFSTVVSSFILYELAGQVLYQVRGSTVFFDTPIYELFAAFTFLGFPLVIGLTVFKYRLYDIDIIINRTLVYGGLSLAIVAIYVLVVGALGALFQSQGSILFALLATGLIAALFQPLRDQLQQRVNRLMFGDRDDPYAILSKLSTQLQTTTTPEATLQSVAETVVETLKLPYVAIKLADEQGPLGGAATGKLLGEKLELPLRYQNETVGRLVVSPRSPGESFNEKEQRLLANIAAQTGPLAHAVRLTAALQRSREKLVLTREEERRRIRRDLHDGLGPVLAGQGLKLSAARHLLKKSPNEASKLLDEVMQQNEATVGEVRRLVYELRPPALDDLGLIGAIEQEGHHLMRKVQLTVTTVPDPLPNLPAAVEVAAYRIVMEALTNVSRHANANSCQVCLDAGEALRIEVVDDGIGYLAEKKPGVGLTSMRERTAELGGQFSIAANKNGGMRIKVILPC